MVTENGRRAPRVAPGRDSLAATVSRLRTANIEHNEPKIGSVTGAMDDLGCMVERLSALMNANVTDLMDDVIDDGSFPAGPARSRAFDLWMIFVIVQEKIAEVDRVVGAITSALYAERRAVRP